MKTKQWFLDRIGKRVYRRSNRCSCLICKEAETNGLIIQDTLQANYLYDIESDTGGEISYFDTKEEAANSTTSRNSTK